MATSAPTRTLFKIRALSVEQSRCQLALSCRSSAENSLLSTELPFVNSDTRCSSQGVTALPDLDMPFATLSVTAISTASCSASPAAWNASGIGTPRRSELGSPNRSLMTESTTLVSEAVQVTTALADCLCDLAGAIESHRCLLGVVKV